MSKKEFSKMLSRAEAKHRYVHIPKDDRDFFPVAHEIFKLVYDGNEFEMKVNHKDDLMTGQLYNIRRFPEGTVLHFTLKKSDTYLLDAEGTEEW